MKISFNAGVAAKHFFRVSRCWLESLAKKD